MKICPQCGSSFVGTHADKRFCSRRCVTAHFNRLESEKRKSRRPTHKPCAYCDIEMTVSPHGRIKTFCSESCQVKAWAQAHPQTIAKRREKNYSKFGEHIRAKSRKWTRDNPERSKERNRVWTKTETGRLATKANNHRRRAHRLNAEGSFTRKQFRDLCALLDCRCQECRTKLPMADLHADHIVAISRGGRNDIGNIQPLCETCNVRKSDTTMNWLTDYALEGVVINEPAEYGLAA